MHVLPKYFTISMQNWTYIILLSEEARSFLLSCMLSFLLVPNQSKSMLSDIISEHNRVTLAIKPTRCLWFFQSFTDFLSKSDSLFSDLHFSITFQWFSWCFTELKNDAKKYIVEQTHENKAVSWEEKKWLC
jgi:hypothetical protein